MYISITHEKYVHTYVWFFFSRVATKLHSAYVLVKDGWVGGRMLAYLR